jgi:hypothetical protein
MNTPKMILSRSPFGSSKNGRQQNHLVTVLRCCRERVIALEAQPIVDRSPVHNRYLEYLRQKTDDAENMFLDSQRWK